MGWNGTTATPVARLGRPVGAVRPVQGAVVLLPDGRPVSRRPPFPPATAAGTLPLARRLVREAGPDGLVVHTVHYRWRDRNGDAAHPADAARWALDEVRRRYGDIPVCLVGTGVGARAALRAADHPAVESVVALAPWLPPSGENCCATTGGPHCDPVAQLADRQVLFVHGTEDRRSDPEHAFRLALRAKRVTGRVCRFEAHGDGHQLHGYRREVRALTVDFALGTLYGRDFARPLTDALLAPAPLGLRMPLAAGFGRAPRRPRGAWRAPAHRDG